jgi:integrase
MTEHENSTSTEISLHRKNENESSPWVTNDRKPLWVYYARLGTGSRRTMISALHAIATMASKGTESFATFVWSKLRYSQTAAIRSALAASYKPATVNKMLAALRGVLKECQRLGWMSADDYQRAVDIPNIKATILPCGRALSPKEIIALQRACSKDSHAAGVRDRAIIALLYGTGLRRGHFVLPGRVSPLLRARKVSASAGFVASALSLATTVANLCDY